MGLPGSASSRPSRGGAGPGGREGGRGGRGDGASSRHQSGGRGAGAAAKGYRGKGGGNRRPAQQKKSWWTSEFNKMDGELEVPLPWWADRPPEGGWKYKEMKVAELKEELARRGVQANGHKADLVEQLER